MTVCVIIAAALAIAYTALVVWKDKGLPTSLSSSVFTLSDKWKWLFGFVMLTCGVFIGTAMMSRASDGTAWLGFLTIVGMGIVAVTPLFDPDKLTAHYVGAFMAAGCSQLLIAINKPLCLFAWLIYVSYTLASTNCSRKVLWAEVACFMAGIWYCLTN